MNALTLHQPWATLIALGVKRIETRSWPAPKSAIGQRLVIHAGATIGHHALAHWRDDGTIPQGVKVLTGVIVASCTLTDCVPMVNTGEEGAIRTLDIDGNGSLWIVEPQTDEEADDGVYDQREVTDQLPYGDFRSGRWAWLLDDVEPIDPPVPAKGHQRLWRVRDGRP